MSEDNFSLDRDQKGEFKIGPKPMTAFLVWLAGAPDSLRAETKPYFERYNEERERLKKACAGVQEDRDETNRQRKLTGNNDLVINRSQAAVIRAERKFEAAKAVAADAAAIGAAAEAEMELLENDLRGKLSDWADTYDI